MAFTTGNDVNIVQSTDAAIISALEGDDKYIISGDLIGAGQTISIDDSQGSNTIQLVGGLSISSSSVTATATQLTLSNGAVITLLGANTFSYLVGGDSLTGAGGTTEDYSTFVTNTLGLASVPTDNTPVDGGAIEVGGGSTGEGQTFDLTTGTDVYSGTSGNDTFNATTSNSLTAADTLTDSSSTDDDVLNANVTSSAGAPRLQNIETINVDGQFVNTGIDLANVSGTTVLNVNTGIVSGTAAVSNASTVGGMAVNAGDNISTLTVTASAAGTRDTVTVDANNASSVTLTGDAGVDTFVADVASGATAVLNGQGGTDSYTLNIAGGTLNLTGNTATETLVLNNTGAALTATLGGDLTGDYATTTKYGTTVTGDANVTLNATSDQLDAQAVTNTGTGDLTVRITDATAAKDYSNVHAKTLQLTTKAAGAVEVDVSAQSMVELVGDVTDDAAVTLNLGTDTANANAGALSVNVSQSQTDNALTTGDEVGTLVLEATPDQASDTANNAHITIGELKLDDSSATDNGTGVVVVNGAADLEITKLTNQVALNQGSNETVISASAMTGNLTVGATANDLSVTVVGGAGNDTVTANGNTGNNATVTKLYGGAGNDKLTAVVADGTATEVVELRGDAGDDTLVGSAAAATLNGGTGNDTITGGAGNDTIIGGEGNDTINGAGGADAISLGAGTDTVIIDATEDGDTISDFVVGEDTLVLIGSAAAGADKINVGAVTNSSGAVSTFGSAHDFTLTGITSTDLTNVVQLGNSTKAFTAVASSTITAGSKADVITLGSGTNVVVAGDGDDKITTNAGSTKDTLTGGAGNDTFDVNSTTATVITDLSDSDNLDVDASAVSVAAAVTANFTATSSTVNAGAANTAVVLTAENGVGVNLDAATIADATKGFTISTKAGNTTGSTIVGSKGADAINGSGAADTLTGSEGADVLTGGNGIDTIILTEQVTAKDDVVLTTGTANYDVITGFSSGADNDDLMLADGTFAWFNGTSDGAVAVAAGATLDAAHTANANATVVNLDTDFATTGLLAQLAAGSKTTTDVIAEAATAMGVATDANFANTDKILVGIDDGTSTALFYVQSDGADNAITAAEVQLVGVLNGVSADLVAADFDFS